MDLPFDIDIPVIVSVRSNLRKSRKDHICSNCNGKIAAGEFAYTVTELFSGEGYITRYYHDTINHCVQG